MYVRAFILRRRGDQTREQFHTFVKEELAELHEGLAAATRAREEADDEILQVRTSHTTDIIVGIFHPRYCVQRLHGIRSSTPNKMFRVTYDKTLVLHVQAINEYTTALQRGLQSVGGLCSSTATA